MSQPKRYDVGMTEETCPTMGISRWPWVYPCEQGKYVLHSDYAALAAENERLRKAGDRLASATIIFETMSEKDREQRRADWLAAKEGSDAK